MEFGHAPPDLQRTALPVHLECHGQMHVQGLVPQQLHAHAVQQAPGGETGRDGRIAAIAEPGAGRHAFQL